MTAHDPRQLSIHINAKSPQLKPVPERQARCKMGHVLTQYEYSPGKFAPVRCYVCPPGEFRPNLEPIDP